MKKIIIPVIVIAILGVGVAFYMLRDTSSTQVPSSTTENTTTPPPKEPENFNKEMYSLTDPTSLWFIANKHYALPITYIPSDLTTVNAPLRLAKTDMQMQIRTVAATDLQQLFDDGANEGLQLEFGSGYRSAAYQKTLYDGYVASMGKAEADRSSARSGHSEHQTGLALDFTRIDGKCHLESCFADLPEGKWLATNAYKYGFILRYPQGKETTTGYMFEPWHFRYVGKDLAKELHEKNIQTLEEFFGLSNASDYL